MSKVIMISPENVTGASIDGKEYKVKNGKIKADIEHCAELCSFGFVTESEESASDDETLLKQLEAEEAEKKKLEAEALKKAGVDDKK